MAKDNHQNGIASQYIEYFNSTPRLGYFSSCFDFPSYLTLYIKSVKCIVIKNLKIKKIYAIETCKDDRILKFLNS